MLSFFFFFFFFSVQSLHDLEKKKSALAEGTWHLIILPMAQFEGRTTEENKFTSIL